MELNNSEKSSSIRKVNMTEFSLAPERYELRSGQEDQAPLCPYGNHYKWIGYDRKRKEYVRFTKSVFKLLVGKNKLKSRNNSNRQI